MPTISEMSIGVSVIALENFERIGEIYLGKSYNANLGVGTGADYQYEEDGTYSIGEPFIAVSYPTVIGSENEINVLMYPLPL